MAQGLAGALGDEAPMPLTERIVTLFRCATDGWRERHIWLLVTYPALAAHSKEQFVQAEAAIEAEVGNMIARITLL